MLVWRVLTVMCCFLCRFTEARLADMHALNELDTKAYSFFRWGSAAVSCKQKASVCNWWRGGLYHLLSVRKVM
jgi:hypothetical protein